MAPLCFHVLVSEIPASESQNEVKEAALESGTCHVLDNLDRLRQPSSLESDLFITLQ